MKSNKKVILGAVSAIVASITAGILVKNNMDKKSKSETGNLKEKNQKKSKNVYYTVHLNDIYNTYEDKTVSEDDMIEAIKKETTL